MTATYPLKIIDNRRCFPKKVEDIADEVPIGGALRVLSPTEYLSYQQIRWWKGVLLPALEKDTGDTVLEWENRFKREVMPDEFPVKVSKYAGKEYQYLPSITKLSVKKMTTLMKGAVDYCHRPNVGLTWVILPDKVLKNGR